MDAQRIRRWYLQSASLGEKRRIDSHLRRVAWVRQFRRHRAAGGDGDKLHTSVPLPAPVSSPITWTATATGGVGPLLYQFWRLRQGVGWTMVQDYSTLNTFSWTPVEADAGSYVLQVWVKSSLSAALSTHGAARGISRSVHRAPFRSRA